MHIHTITANYKSLKQSGVSMIEVLVLIIIMSIGLLGIAGLQVTSVKQTTNSGFYTQAMFLTEDIIAKIRANRAAVMSGDTVIETNYGKQNGSDFPTAATASCTTSAGCTDAEMATSDLFNWSQLIQNSLPVDAALLKDDTFICLDSDRTDATECDGAGSTFVIQIAWNESSSLDASTTQEYQMVFEP